MIQAYNVEDYLERCFNFIINQTIGFENLEMIFVDDCSTDNRYSIIKKYQDSHDNVMAFRLETNCGATGKP